MMKISDCIAETVSAVQESLEKHGVPGDEIESIVAKVRGIGCQWTEANSHLHAMSIAAGLMADGTDYRTIEGADYETLMAIESKGTAAIFKSLPLAAYAGLVVYFTDRSYREE